MKVGLKTKKYFHDIVVLPRSEIQRIELQLEKHRRSKIPQKKPLVLDAVISQDYIKKGVSRIWQQSHKKKNNVSKIKYYHKRKSIAEVAEYVLEEKTKPKIMVIPTNEELMIARQTFKLIG